MVIYINRRLLHFLWIRQWSSSESFSFDFQMFIVWHDSNCLICKGKSFLFPGQQNGSLSVQWQWDCKWDYYVSGWIFQCSIRIFNFYFHLRSLLTRPSLLPRICHRPIYPLQHFLTRLHHENYLKKNTPRRNCYSYNSFSQNLVLICWHMILFQSVRVRNHLRGYFFQDWSLLDWVIYKGSWNQG